MRRYARYLILVFCLLAVGIGIAGQRVLPLDNTFEPDTGERLYDQGKEHLEQRLCRHE